MNRYAIYCLAPFARSDTGYDSRAVYGHTLSMDSGGPPGHPLNDYPPVRV